MAVTVLALFIVLGRPSVQTALVKLITDELQDKLNGRIELGHVNVKGINSFVINDFYLLDKDPFTDMSGNCFPAVDTIIRAKECSGTFSILSLLGGEGISIKRLSLNHGMLHLVTEKGRWTSNTARAFNSPLPPEEPVEKPAIFNIRKLKVRDFNFKLNNMVQVKECIAPPGFSWNDLDIDIPELDARKVSFKGGRLTLFLDHLSMSDKGGYSASHIAGKARIGMGRVIARDLRIEDKWSEIDIPDLGMSFHNAYAFRDFCDSVRLQVHVGPSVLGGMTLRYFIPSLPDNTASFQISQAFAEGPVNDLFVSDCKLKEIHSGTTLELETRIRDLEVASNVAFDARLKKAVCTTKGITTLLKAFRPDSPTDLGKLAPQVPIIISGTAKGPVTDLRTRIHIVMDSGQFDASVRFANMTDKRRDTRVSGSIKADEFRLGTLLDNSLFGNLDARAELDADLQPGSMSLKLDSLFVDKLSFKGYEYSGITAVGEMSDKSFDGKLTCDDPSLKFSYQGLSNIIPGSQDARYKFFADLAYADLKAMNLDTRDNPASKVSCNVVSDFSIVDKGDIVGDLRIQDIVLNDGKAVKRIGDINIDSRTNEEDFRINLVSKFLEGRFTGTGPVPSMIAYLKSLTLDKHLDALLPGGRTSSGPGPGDYDLRLDFHDSRDILSFVKPGLYIADSTKMSMSVRRDGSLDVGINSPRLALGRNYLKRTDISIDNDDDRLNAFIDNSEIKVAGALIRNASLSVKAFSDTVDLNLGIKGTEEGKDNGNISMQVLLDRNERDSLTIDARPLPSHYFIDGERWIIDSSSVRLCGKSVSVEGFRIHCDDQMMMVDGGVFGHDSDTLNVVIRELTMGIIPGITGKDIDMNGFVNGHARLVSQATGSLQANVNFSCDSLSVDNNDVGSLALTGSWDEDNDRLDIDFKNSKDGRHPLLAKGYIYPGTRELDCSAQLDNMNLALAGPFLTDIMSDMGGYVSGRISVNGDLSSPQISSDGMRFNSSRFRIGATGVAYTIDGPVNVNNEGITLEDLTVTDEAAGNAHLKGGLVFDPNGKSALNARMNMEDLQVLNLPEGSDKRFYGKLSASGLLGISGPLDDFSVDGFVTTSGAGQVNVPLNTSISSSSSDLLTFREIEKDVYIDPYDEMMNDIPVVTKRHKGNIRIHLRASATPDVKAVIELNKSTGNVISANGLANVMVDMETSTNNLQLVGDYKISGGDMNFEIPGIVRKSFTIKDGSVIKFNGNPKDSHMDITANYKLKTSLSNLLSDTTSVLSRRLVDCSINLSGDLRNPEINFGVDVPDLSPDNRAKMAEALNTSDKVQKQFIALLVMGNFLPNEQSGIVNGSNILYSNVSQIMSNQLNNILQKLDIPVDLGLGYQQNNAGTNIFDVAISTQLFNNRVEIGGTVGNRQYKSSKNPYGDVVGDIDISIKLDKSGQFKLNLFSHSADEYTSFLDFSQRNGVGFNYSKEYDNFWKMLHEIFTPKDKKGEQTPAEREPRKRKTIVIKQ